MSNFETPRQNPFSLYDLIGYFTPGAIFIFLLLIFDVEESNVESYANTSNKEKGSICTICKFFKNLTLSCDTSFLHGITSLAFFFVVAYVVGQIISILSNFIIEKSQICRHHNYFSYLLLSNKNSKKIIKNKDFFFTICY